MGTRWANRRTPDKEKTSRGHPCRSVVIRVHPWMHAQASVGTGIPKDRNRPNLQRVRLDSLRPRLTLEAGPILLRSRFKPRYSGPMSHGPFWIDGVRPGRLGTMPCPDGDGALERQIQALRDEGVTILVSLLQPPEVEFLGVAREAELCAAADIEFVSFPIRDGGVPASLPDAAALVRRLADLLARGEHVVIHCLGGIGRSSTIAAAVLAARGVTPADALARISEARGLSVPETAEQSRWVENFASGLS